MNLVCANVEKIIFLAPKAIHIPIEHPNLDDLRLDTLTLSHLTLRCWLPASFPNKTHQKGTEAWFLLDGLKQDQRYEVRICWSATVSATSLRWMANTFPENNVELKTNLPAQQPTAFALYTHPVEQVFNDTALISALAVYSEARQSTIRDQANLKDHAGVEVPGRAAGTTNSVLFLQIFAAADYFTTNKKLMREVPPVEIDISKVALVTQAATKLMRQWLSSRSILPERLTTVPASYSTLSRYHSHCRVVPVQECLGVVPISC